MHSRNSLSLFATSCAHPYTYMSAHAGTRMSRAHSLELPLLLCHLLRTCGHARKHCMTAGICCSMTFLSCAMHAQVSTCMSHFPLQDLPLLAHACGVMSTAVLMLSLPSPPVHKHAHAHTCMSHLLNYQLPLLLAQVWTCMCMPAEACMLFGTYGQACTLLCKRAHWCLQVSCSQMH